jgi:group I intron endonuclease
MQSGIYEIAFGADKYIGSSINMPNRIKGHIKALKSGRHCNSRLKDAFARFPLTWRVVLVCRTEDLLLFEQRAIDTMRPSLNISTIAGKIEHTAEVRAKISAAATGRSCSAETRLKLSAAGRGRVHSPEVKAKMSAAHTGKAKPYAKSRFFTPEARAIAAAAHRGKTVSAECRAKISAAMRGHKKSDETKAKMRAAQLGRPSPHRGKKFGPMSAETKAKISAAKRAGFLERSARSAG